MLNPDQNKANISELKISPAGLMDLDNAARYLGVKVGTIRWLRRTKKLPFAKIGGRILVKKNDLDEFIENNTEPALISGKKQGF